MRRLFSLAFIGSSFQYTVSKFSSRLVITHGTTGRNGSLRDEHQSTLKTGTVGATVEKQADRWTGPKRAG